MRSRSDSSVARIHRGTVVVPLVYDECPIHIDPDAIVRTGGEAVSPCGKINALGPASDEVVDVDWRARCAAAPVKVNDWIGACYIWRHCRYSWRAARPCVPVLGRVAITW